MAGARSALNRPSASERRGMLEIPNDIRRQLAQTKAIIASRPSTSYRGILFKQYRVDPATLKGGGGGQAGRWLPPIGALGCAPCWVFAKTMPPEAIRAPMRVRPDGRSCNPRGV